MSLPVNIEDGHFGTGKQAAVTSIGQLVTAPYAYDETKFNELAADNTAYNYYAPKVGEQFVITVVIAYGDKQVGTTTGATVVIYEATAPDTLTVSKTLMQFEIPQVASVPIPRLNLLVSEGKYVNAKTDDDDIHMTIMGYYIPALS